MFWRSFLPLSSGCEHFSNQSPTTEGGNNPPSKYWQLFTSQQGSISQKTWIFIITTMKTSNPTCRSIFRSSLCQISWKCSHDFVDWFMKLVGGLDILINVAILTGTFWRPVFVNTLESEGLSNTVFYNLCLFMRLSQLISELHSDCWVRVWKIIVLVYELHHIFQGTCFTKTVFFQVPLPPHLLPSVLFCVYSGSWKGDTC